ncbi:MAG TPA: hypothetical protein VK528_14420 [Flavobacterium sp.]|nr:hypothetical protein [Flavobacterium sp.]
MKKLRIIGITMAVIFSVCFALSAFTTGNEKSEPYHDQDFQPSQQEINRRLALEVDVIKSDVHVMLAEAQAKTK